MKRPTQELSPLDQAQGLQRRQLGRMALGAVALWGLAACGGGGGDSNKALNLREAYDRVEGGMNHEQVKNAVGAERTGGTLMTEYWQNDSEMLTVNYVKTLDGERYYAGTISWDGLGGGGYEQKEYHPR